MKTKASLLLMLFPLFLSANVFGTNDLPTENNKIFFEEIGQFNDEGMAVTVLVVDNYAYVCEFDNGPEILDISDPARPVKIGSFFDGGRPNGFQVVGNLIYIADGNDGLEIVRFKNNGNPLAQEK